MMPLNEQPKSIAQNFTQEQAKDIVALYNTTGAVQRWLLLAMYKRKAHLAYNIDDFGYFVEKVLESEQSRSHIYRQIQWAELEMTLEGIPHKLAALFSDEATLKQIPAEMTETVQGEGGRFVKTPSRLLTTAWFNELNRLPNDEAKKQVYNEIKGAMEHEQRNPADYNKDIKRRVDGYLSAKGHQSEAQMPVETPPDSKSVVLSKAVIVDNDFSLVGFNENSGSSTQNSAISPNMETVSETFAHEHHLRDYLAQNLSLVEPGLKLYINNDIKGIEYPAGRRFIDILALSSSNDFVVIELKVSRGDDQAIGQLLCYIGWVEKKGLW
ncbi:MAG: endonuclease NucS [Armatimonadetes bacterium]|nr:endonuclease NucS [Armatimonadota bacterium]